MAGRSRAQGLWTVARRVLKVTRHGETLRVGNARVVAADIPAANGIVNAIDRVLIPRV